MDEKVKILFCLHYSDLNNGGIRSMIDVIENIIKNDNVTVYIVYPTRKNTAIDYLEKLGVKTIFLPF